MELFSLNEWLLYDTSIFSTVNTLMIGKPEKGKLVENLILQMAQTGQIMNRLSEEELIGLLEKVNQQFGSKQKTTVKVRRKK